MNSTSSGPNDPALAQITRPVSNLQSLLEELRQLEGWSFRGLRDSSWTIESSIERAARRRELNINEYEPFCVREFQRRAQTYFPNLPNLKDTVEWLALMQHYGAPTRLIDFTDSYWVGLFFALEYSEGDSALWAIKHAGLAVPVQWQSYVTDRNKSLANVIKLDTHENQGSLKPIDLIDQDVPFRVNDRLDIQRGRFLFSYEINKPFLRVYQNQFGLNQNQIRKYVIPKNLRNSIVDRLLETNCDARTLFPGPDGFARSFQNLRLH